jgi:hypothetical protein
MSSLWYLRKDKIEEKPVMPNDHVTVPKNIEKKFQALAHAQRGKPENAMLKLQDSQIAQVYGFVAEHTGDLVHRMSEHVNFSRGQYTTVKDKVEKVLRQLESGTRGMLPFEDYILEQIQNNYDYYQQKGQMPQYKSPEQMLGILKKLGRSYADAHKKLKTYNSVQRLAQLASVSVGDFDFDGARKYLNMLKDIMDKGKDAWVQEALAY